DVDGRSETFGRSDGGPSATIKLHDPKFVRRMTLRPGLAIGEGYMEGAYTIEDGTLRDFLEIAVKSSAGKEPKGPVGAFLRLAAPLRRNDGTRAARNVQHHYDIDHRLYERFLDTDMQYSCAYWREGVTSLEQAQTDKKEHIARKLMLKPGMKVLDIGSGWGGMALHLAKNYGVSVTGVTLSVDQYQTSIRRAQEAGLSDRVTFKLQDYRHEPATYDRIVSVGMFEHVGPRNFAEYFRHIDRLLKPDGVALIHTIGRMGPPAPNNAWMNKYIFPGSYIPSLSQLAPVIEEQKLWMTDFEMLRIHYAKTLAAWDERFQAQRAEIAGLFDERFCRMWEFYLQLCETAFRHRTLTVFQMQIAKEIGTVPITRDYMYAAAETAAAERPVAAIEPVGAKPKQRAARRAPQPAVEMPAEIAEASKPAPKRTTRRRSQPTTH
ncbi:MAG: class I SAM-dependent methyltransferase, partial [Bauldia sp.]